MWQRLVRVIKAFFNRFLTAAEDPVMILENNIRDMKNQIPKINEGIARAYGTKKLLENQLSAYTKEEASLRAKLKAAALANEDEIGRDIALQLKRVIDQKAKTEEAYKQAELGLQNLEEMRDVQIRKINAEVEKIRDTIEAAKVAKLKGELAELFETFQVGDVTYSNRDMMEKLQREAATNEGKLEAASKSPDMKNIKLEQKAEEIEAEDLYNQFKSEMNIDIASTSKSAKKTTEKTSVKS